MKYSQLLSILQKTGLSPEDLAPRIGVSNMTIRRWKKADPCSFVPKAYAHLAKEAISQLVTEGKLSARDSEIMSVLKTNGSESVDLALHELGLSEIQLSGGKEQSSTLIQVLHRIGLSENRQSEVKKKKKIISDFKNKGSDWKKAIGTLSSVIQSKKLAYVEKLVAYGAFIYLLCPLDLVPDHVPIFGLTDDFGVLTVAATYYLERILGEPK